MSGKLTSYGLKAAQIVGNSSFLAEGVVRGQGARRGQEGVPGVGARGTSGSELGANTNTSV